MNTNLTSLSADQLIAHAQDRGVICLTPPRSFDLGDTSYHEFADTSHFWIRARIACIKALLRNISIGKTPIEIGCGRAATAVALQDYFKIPIACADIDLKALCEIDGIKERYFYDVTLPHEQWANHFSALFILDVLEHVPDPGLFLKMLHGHLADGGIMIVNVPALPRLYSNYDAVQGHRTRYTKRVLIDELEAAGFSIESCHYWGFFMVPIVLLRNLIMAITPPPTAIKAGFKSPSKLISSFFSFFYAFERTFLPKPPLGTSVLALCRKSTSNQSTGE